MKYDPKYDALIAAKDALRKAFLGQFDLARWRRQSKKFKNKKKEQDKYKCRSKNQED